MESASELAPARVDGKLTLRPRVSVGRTGGFGGGNGSTNGGGGGAGFGGAIFVSGGIHAGEPFPADFAARYGLGDWQPIAVVEGLA